MFRWEPGHFSHRLCTAAIAPFWFSTEHLWTAIAPFWLSTEHFWTALMPFWFSTEYLWTAIAPFWLSTEHFWTALMPFWFSTEHLWTAIMPFCLSTLDMSPWLEWVFISKDDGYNFFPYSLIYHRAIQGCIMGRDAHARRRECIDDIFVWNNPYTNLYHMTLTLSIR